MAKPPYSEPKVGQEWRIIGASGYTIKILEIDKIPYEGRQVTHAAVRRMQDNFLSWVPIGFFNMDCRLILGPGEKNEREGDCPWVPVPFKEK